MDKFDAAGLLVKLNGLVLLGKRSKICLSLPGNWSMPCGAVEEGESAKSAAVREFFEETGFNITSGVFPLNLFKMNNGGTFFVYTVGIEDFIFPSSKAKDAIEHDEWGYFKIEENCLPTPMTEETKNAILMLK